MDHCGYFYLKNGSNENTTYVNTLTDGNGYIKHALINQCFSSAIAL